jgi:hypothetical protein
MRNMKVIIIIKSIYWSAWQQPRDKLLASNGERKQISTEEAKKQRQRWREIYKERTLSITKNKNTTITNKYTNNFR